MAGALAASAAQGVPVPVAAELLHAFAAGMRTGRAEWKDQVDAD